MSQENVDDTRVMGREGVGGRCVHRKGATCHLAPRTREPKLALLLLPHAPGVTMAFINYTVSYFWNVSNQVCNSYRNREAMALLDKFHYKMRGE
jgi:hypothetical protein